jgi:hypothetical protein
MQRFLIAIAIVAVLALGGGLIAVTAYQAGLSTAVVAGGVAGTATDGAVVTPVVVPPGAYGWGWGPGFGFFGFLGFLLFLFLLFGLLRALFWRGPGRGRGWGPGGDHQHPWESRARTTFTEWHREAHATDQPPS